MNKMSTSELTARINRFLDRKMPTTIDLAELNSTRARRSQRRNVEVSTTPYITLAVR